MSLNPIRLQEYVSGLDYPVSREDLVRRAREQGADQEELHTLQCWREKSSTRRTT